MKSRRIICIVNDIWENSDEVWGFNTFRENGYCVEIWRVGALTIGTKIWEKPQFSYPVITIESKKELDSKILKMSLYKPIYLFYFSESKYFDKEKALIKLLGGKYCNVSIGPLGSRDNHLQLREVMSRKRHWMDNFLATYNFLAAEIHKCGLHSKFEAEYENNIMIHTYDYDYYLRNQNSKSKCGKEYILFYDQNFLEHKDIINYGIKRRITNEKVYIKEISNLLLKIEMEYGLPVVIAAHPTSKNANLKKIYGSREIIYGKTCEYTKNAKWVVTCASGAINYAVLYKKPILFWTCYQIKNSDIYFEWQCIRCNILKAKILDISDNLKGNIQNYLTNPDNYEKFMNYITSNPNEKRLFFDIVVGYLNKM